MNKLNEKLKCEFLIFGHVARQESNRWTLRFVQTGDVCDKF